MDNLQKKQNHKKLSRIDKKKVGSSTTDNLVPNSDLTIPQNNHQIHGSSSSSFFMHLIIVMMRRTQQWVFCIPDFIILLLLGDG